jgi:hypothetical protein
VDCKHRSIEHIYRALLLLLLLPLLNVTSEAKRGFRSPSPAAASAASAQEMKRDRNPERNGGDGTICFSRVPKLSPSRFEPILYYHFVHVHIYDVDDDDDDDDDEDSIFLHISSHYIPLFYAVCLTVVASMYSLRLFYALIVVSATAAA